MAETKNEQRADQTGIDKPMKTPVEAYDAEHGHYEGNTCSDDLSVQRPSKNTKKPFGGLGG